MSAHLAGRSVSASTYTNHHCRCDGCREEWATYARNSRWRKVWQRANGQAGLWVRENRPDVWTEVLAAANEATP